MPDKIKQAMIDRGQLQESSLEPPERNTTVDIILHCYAICRRSRAYVETVELPLGLDVVKIYYDYYQPPVDKRTLADCVMMLDDIYRASDDT